MSVKKYEAFTLAEVLITLAIIGVISALVIPAMIQNIQDAHFKTAYKKAFSVANQAIIKAYTNNQLVIMTNTYDIENMPVNFNAFMNQFVVAKSCPYDAYNCWNTSGEFITDPEEVPYSSALAFIDSSGMAWTTYDEGLQLIMVDTNGNKGPNRYGKDRWFFKLIDANGSYSSGIPIKIAPYHDVDITGTAWDCHYPPCNNISWLKQ